MNVRSHESGRQVCRWETAWCELYPRRFQDGPEGKLSAFIIIFRNSVQTFKCFFFFFYVLVYVCIANIYVYAVWCKIITFIIYFVLLLTDSSSFHETFLEYNFSDRFLIPKHTFMCLLIYSGIKSFCVTEDYYLWNGRRFLFTVL